MEIDTSTNPATEPDSEAPEQEVDTTDAEDLAAEPQDAEYDGEDGAEDEEELDIDGDPLKVPKTLAEKLKARMMMQADYTQKTQTLAEQRRDLEMQRQATQWEHQTRAELFREEAALFNVSQRLAEYQNVNWQALAQQDVQQYAAAQAEYTQLKDYAERLSGTVEGRKAELAAKTEHERAIGLERAMQHLSTPKPDIGWDGKFDADKRASLTKFGMELGFTNEELSNTSHPLMIQTLNLARIGYETLRKQSAALKKATPEAKPVPAVATGKTRTGPVNPDKLPMDQWLKYRENQLARKQRTR